MRPTLKLLQRICDRRMRRSGRLQPRQQRPFENAKLLHRRGSFKQLFAEFTSLPSPKFIQRNVALAQFIRRQTEEWKSPTRLEMHGHDEFLASRIDDVKFRPGP